MDYKLAKQLKEERIIEKLPNGDWIGITIPPRKFISKEMWKAISDALYKKRLQLLNYI